MKYQENIDILEKVTNVQQLIFFFSIRETIYYL